MWGILCACTSRPAVVRSISFFPGWWIYAALGFVSESMCMRYGKLSYIFMLRSIILFHSPASNYAPVRDLARVLVCVCVLLDDGFMIYIRRNIATGTAVWHNDIWNEFYALASIIPTTGRLWFVANEESNICLRVQRMCVCLVSCRERVPRNNPVSRYQAVGSVIELWWRWGVIKMADVADFFCIRIIFLGK